VREVVADALDGSIGGRLNILLEALGLVLGQLGLLHGLKRVAADVANVHAALFGEAVGGLDEFLPALAAHFRQRDADHLAVGDWVESEVGLLDALDDRLDQAGVPRLDLDEPSVGRADGRAALQGRHRTIGLNHHALDHLGSGLAGVDGAEFMQRVVHGLFHAGLGVGQDGMAHGWRR
jgi:hypothetical protein